MLQIDLYGHVLRSKAVSSLLTGAAVTGGADALSVITTLRKLCNHPDLLHRPDAAGKQAAEGTAANGSAVEDLQRWFPADYQRGDSAHSGQGGMH